MVVMGEYRYILAFLIGLSLFVSIWRISLEDGAFIESQSEYNTLELVNQPTIIKLRQTQSEPSESRSKEHNQATNSKRTTPLNFATENSLPTNNLSSLALTPSSSATQSAPYKDYDSLQTSDYSTLIDLKDFQFTINQHSCEHNKDLFFLILIHSAPSNYKKRQVIRETWGSVQSRYLRLLFLVGSVPTEELQERLENENERFSDLVQGNFVDDYRNMTYKHVMAFKWFVYYCVDAKYLIKTDDDVFVNTLQLLDYVDEKLQLLHQPPLLSPFTPRTYHVPSRSSDSLSRNASHIFNILQSKNFLFCLRTQEAPVRRSYRSKWRVSAKEYAGRYYPPYCPGYSIIYSPDVVFRLYREAQKAKYFWIDDVHITGTLSQRSNITITDSSPWAIDPKTYDKVLSGRMDISRVFFLFAWVNISEQQIRDLWDLTSNYFDTTRFSGRSTHKRYPLR